MGRKAIERRIQVGEFKGCFQSGCCMKCWRLSRHFLRTVFAMMMPIWVEKKAN